MAIAVLFVCRRLAKTASVAQWPNNLTEVISASAIVANGAEFTLIGTSDPVVK